MNPLLEALLTTAFPGWRALGRLSWCRKQRRRLRAHAREIVWVHDGDKVPWAFWGAQNGFFELEWAGQLPYLRATAAAG